MTLWRALGLISTFISVSAHAQYRDEDFKLLFVSENWLRGELRNTQQFVAHRDGILCVKRTVKKGKDATKTSPAVPTEYGFMSDDWDNRACLELSQLKEKNKIEGHFLSEKNSPRSMINGKLEGSGNTFDIVATKKSFQNTPDGKLEVEVLLSVTMKVYDIKMEKWILASTENMPMKFLRSAEGIWTTQGKENGRWAAFSTLKTTVTVNWQSFTLLLSNPTQKKPHRIDIEDFEFLK